MTTGPVLPNFQQYVPPGVYWQQTQTPVTAITAPNPNVVAIVGPGIGYRTQTDTIVLNGTTPVQLSQFGVNDSSVVVTNYNGSVTYTDVTDYVLVQSGDTDGNSIDTVTTIASSGTGGITNGETVVVSYRYTDYAYYSPTAVSDFASVKNLYGQPLDTNTGAILSPISFAAQFAFGNGARNLVLVACQTSSGTTTTRTFIQDAYTLLAPVENVNLVVVLPCGLTGTQGSPGDIINLAQDLSSFVDQQEITNGIFTVGLIGYESTETVNPDYIASSTLDDRVVEAWPNQMSFYNGFTNTTQTLSGYYLAAAYAGILAANPVQQGLTKQFVQGFSGIPPFIFNTMSNTYKNQLSAAGVAVTEITRNGALQVRHGVTTDPSSVYTREISLVRAQDYMVLSCLDTLEGAALIGTPITENTIPTITGLVNGVLNSLVNSGVIAGFSNVNVTQQTLNPTVIEIQFEYKPSYPLNYITFVFSIDTSNGTVISGGATSSGSSNSSGQG